jgi:hypothetical protein
MSISRRDFMKMVGISVASLALTNCRIPPPVSCYAPLPPTPYSTDASTAKGRLRRFWMSFGELAQKTIEESNLGSSDNKYGQQLVSEHRQALEELVAERIVPSSVADLVQEAFDAAVYHVWRSNAPITCYEPMMVNFAPVSAAVLVEQSTVLTELAKNGSIDPEILAKAQNAIEHDMAFYALTEEEVANLYDRLVLEWQAQQQTLPAFKEVELEITPEAKAATHFIISLLTGQ